MGHAQRAHKHVPQDQPEHLQRYVNEFSGKHNIATKDTIDQMGTVAQGMAGKRLPYRTLVADNGRTNGARSA